MGKENGYIRLWRKLRENPIYKNSKAVHVWVECLMRATYQERKFYNGRDKLELEPGQFVMGRQEFGDVIGMSGSTAWYWIQEFEADNMVNIKSTAKGSIVTIENWNDYQKVDNTSDNKKTAKKQQKNTNNKVKKDKKVNKHIKSVFDFWVDQQETISHRKLTTPMRKAIKARLKDYAVEEIKQAIENYNMVVNSDDYFFSYDSWSLDDFLSRGEGKQLEKFLENPSGFKKDKNEGSGEKTKRNHSTVTKEDKEAMGL